MVMKYALAIAAAVGVVATATAASAGKKHPRYVRPRAPAVVAPAPAHVIRPHPSVSPYTCIQDDGYGRWSYCGQGAQVN